MSHNSQIFESSVTCMYGYIPVPILNVCLIHVCLIQKLSSDRNAFACYQEAIADFMNITILTFSSSKNNTNYKLESKKFQANEN